MNPTPLQPPGPGVSSAGEGEAELREWEAERAALSARIAELENRVCEQEVAARELIEARLGQLHRVTVALAEALLPGQVARVLIQEGLQSGQGLEACAGTVLLLTPEGTLLVSASFGEDVALLGPVRRISLDTPLPHAQVARTGQPLWLGTSEALAEAWPSLGPVRHELGVQACAVLPLGEGRAQGVLGLSFRTPRAFPPEERAFLLALANLGGQALERGRLYMAERALRAETERTARTLDAFIIHAPAALSLSDLKGRLLLTNPVFELLGLDVKVGNRRAAAEGNAVEVEGDVSTSVGTRTLHCVHFPVWDAEGTLVATGTITTDLTERRRAEEAFRFLADTGSVLSSSLVDEALLERLALVAVPRFGDWCAVHLKDARGGPVQLLASAHRDQNKEMVLRSLLERRLPVPGVTDALAEVLATGRSVLSSAMPLESLGAAQDAELGELLRALELGSVMVVPLQVQGRVLGALSFGTGVGRRAYDSVDLAAGEELGRRLAVAIDNAHLFAVVQTERARAEAASRHKDEFLAMVSHELRTPLTAILGWTQLLRARSFTEDRQAHALSIIERNARTQAQLIEDLLDVSRITTGRVRLEMEDVALEAVVDTALEAVRPVAEAKGVALEASVDPEVPRVTGDVVRLQQVAWNLVSNAVKFTPPRGQVRVRLERDREKEGARLVVEDNGEGIPPAFLPHLFGRFRQADTSPKRLHKGLGLGLSIVRALVEMHGGTVRAESEGRGKGARFLVWLPPRVSAPASEPARASLAPVRRLEKVRVLVVDDQPEVVEFLTELLTVEGAQVAGVESAAAAMQRLVQEPFDVLVADVSMPGEDGLTMVRRLRELPAEAGGMVPALALTAYAREVDCAAALAAGFTAHMPKPVEAQSLVEMVVLLSRASPFASASF